MTAVVTGANSGVGYWTAHALVEHGANVVLACRDLKRSQPALIKTRNLGKGSAELIQLDLADLDSIPGFVDELKTKTDRLDILVNNAGLMGGPRRDTAQGFELQMGTNHLGHFALTAQLWPLLRNAESPHVVSLSSLASRSGMLHASMDAAFLIDPRPYFTFSVYSNTKQATLLFSQELHRRCGAQNIGVKSFAAHPGISSTNLFNRQMRDYGLGFATPVATTLGRAAFASPKGAARPSIMAATDRRLPSGSFVGPSNLGQIRGTPEVIKLYSVGRDAATAARLWELSEEITGRQFSTI